MSATQNQDSIVGNIFFTENLDQFKSLKGNRSKNIRHIYKISKSINNIGLLMNPIIVNENREVVDGQHRLEAARKSESGIYYIVASGYKLKEVQALNVNSRRWTITDYIEGYANLKMNSYISLAQLINKYPMFSPSQCARVAMMRSTGGDTCPVINGNFKFLKGVDYCEDILNKLIKLGEVFEGYNRSSFVSIICILLKDKSKEFSLDYLIEKAYKYPNLLQPQAGQKRTLENIEYVYNYRNHSKVNLRY